MSIHRMNVNPQMDHHTTYSKVSTTMMIHVAAVVAVANTALVPTVRFARSAYVCNTIYQYTVCCAVLFVQPLELADRHCSAAGCCFLMTKTSVLKHSSIE